MPQWKSKPAKNNLHWGRDLMEERRAHRDVAGSGLTTRSGAATSFYSYADSRAAK